MCANCMSRISLCMFFIRARLPVIVFSTRTIPFAFTLMLYATKTRFRCTAIRRPG